MRERRRRHDDAHYPMQGRGKRATMPKGSYSVPVAPTRPADAHLPQPDKSKAIDWPATKGTSGGLCLPPAHDAARSAS